MEREEEPIQLHEKIPSQDRAAVVGVQKYLPQLLLGTTSAVLLPAGSNVNILIITNRIHARLYSH